MTIREIAHKLNDLSSQYKIGKLPEIRKEIKGFKRRPGSTIFHDKSISDKGWAFHYGGSKEMQFNIGFEKEGLRFGLAFSFTETRTLPDISILFSSIYKLNCLIREEPGKFKSYKMWHWNRENMIRGEINEVQEIDWKLVRDKIFIFFGRIVPYEKVDFDEILSTFDDLLEIYLVVENKGKNDYPDIIKETKSADFKFSKKKRKLITKRKYNLTERAINIDVRHTILQQKLIDELIVEYGDENVSYENPFNGNKIDIVVNQNKDYTFFEVKTGSSAKACIREAIGQLLEYAYWNGKENAKKLVIASEYNLNEEGQKYLNFLNNKFNLPIEYRRIKLEN